MTSVLNFRSDTQTLPTPQMLAAIQTAPLGDDTFDEDPTVNRLEAMAAEKLGKEAAMLVISGTMGNLCASAGTCESGGRSFARLRVAHLLLRSGQHGQRRRTDADACSQPRRFP